MAIPSRKNRMIQKIIKDQKRDKEKIKIEPKEISSEEHHKRLEILKKIGLVN